MKRSSTTKKRAMIFCTLLATLAFMPNRARADAPVICGGAYGYSYGEPFWVGDVWSIQVTTMCSDGTTEYGVGPVAPEGGGGDFGSPDWEWWGSDDDREMDVN